MQMARRPRKLPGLSTKYAMQKFIESRKAANCDSETVYWYQVRLETFLADAPPKVAYIRADHIREFLADSIKEGLSENTINGRYRALRAFFNFLYKEQLIHSNPIENVEAPKVGMVIIKTFTHEELQALFRAIDKTTFVGLRDMALLYMLYDTGIRISEALSVRRKDVFPQHLYVLGKGNKERLVPFGKKAQGYLNQYLEELGTVPVDNLFVSEDNRPLSRRAVDNRIKKYGRKAGITDVRLSAHTFRHTFAIDFLRNGGNVRALQEILGHSSYAMVKRYTHMVESDIKSAHQQYSPGDRLNL